MVDREVNWAVWVVLGRSWGLCVRSWAALGAYVGGLGVLGPMLAILSCSWASTGGPGPLLGPLCVVLGRSWSLCWRSWAVPGLYARDLGQLLGTKRLQNAKNMATLKMCLFPERERDLRPQGRS